MKLSIIIPAYNAEATLRQSLDSLLSQTLRDMEVIVIDDGSTDGTARILDDYARKDSRVKVRHTANGGQAVARNHGLDMACGQYIGFMDADDVLEVDDMLERYVSYLDSHPETDVIQFPTLWKTPGKEELKGKIESRVQGFEQLAQSLLNRQLTGIVWDKIYKRSIFDKVRFAPGRYFEDSWLVMDMLPHIGILDFVPYGYYTYIFREGSEMNSSLSEKKWCHRLERNIRLLRLFKEDKRTTATYAEHYSNALSILRQAIREYGGSSFKKYESEMLDLRPSAVTMAKTPGGRRLALKLAFINIFGLKAFISLR